MSKICDCGHSEIFHPKTKFESRCLVIMCQCSDFREKPIILHTIISVYKINQYTINQLSAREFTNADAANLINENQEWLRVPDEPEELMQMKHYYFDNLPELQRKDIAGIIANGLYQGHKLTVDWRPRELPKHSSVQTQDEKPDSYHDLSKPCYCSHYREVHARYWGECSECPPQYCKKFWQEQINA